LWPQPHPLHNRRKQLLRLQRQRPNSLNRNHPNLNQYQRQKSRLPSRLKSQNVSAHAGARKNQAAQIRKHLPNPA
jgi:hypothetical protein